MPSVFLSKQYSDRYLRPYFLKICRKWKSGQFLVFCGFLSQLVFIKITKWALLQMLEAN